MTIDYGSVLLAVGAAGAALCFTLFSNWLKQRTSGYLAAWAVAMALIILSVGLFAAYSAGGHSLYGLSAGLSLVWGFVISLAGTEDFAFARHSRWRTVVLGCTLSLCLIAPYTLGFTGLSYILINAFSAVLVAVSAGIFWRVRAESPSAMVTLVVLHGLVAFTFALCVVPILLDDPLHLNGSPNNWAELINLVTCVIGITGVGGLLVTVHQERIARAYRHAANTDALTGVLNRRAVGDAFPDGGIPANTAMIILDLDGFKGINDRYGHTFGDSVLLRFASLLDDVVVAPGLCARLGGEEFAVILPGSGVQQARALAEMVRLRFAHQRFRHEQQAVSCTVSAGISVSGAKGCSLDQLINLADSALYVSKRDGRNRVTSSGSRRAA